MRSFAFIEFWDRSSWKRENLSGKRERERGKARKGEMGGELAGINSPPGASLFTI